MYTHILFSDHLYNFLRITDFTVLYLPANHHKYDILPQAGEVNFVMAARHKNDQVIFYELEIMLDHMTLSELNDIFSLGPAVKLWIEMPNNLAAHFMQTLQLPDPYIFFNN